MDSMRSLDTSLPRTRRRRQQGNNEVLQAFKAAALSVTQLYKNASADVETARTTGYQDALDDLLVFLDQENIGLGDGEGWRIRQWATERLSPSSFGFSSDNEEEDRNERGRTSSPPRHTPAENVSQFSRERQNQSAPPAEIPPAQPSTTVAETSLPQSNVFTFRASDPSMPDVEMNSTEAISHPVRLDVLPRSSRANLSGRSSHSSRSQLPSISIGNIGSGAGSKRKQNFGDFFDISGLGGKDFGGCGGSKRSRLG